MTKSLLLCLVLLATSVATPAFSSPAGTLSRFAGDVYVKTGGDASYQPVKSAMPISEGWWVKTGKNGWLELELSDKSRLTLANNSEMEIELFRISTNKKDGLFNLTQGKLRASVTKSAGLTTSIKVKSKAVVAGVKGTEFLMLTQGLANVFFGNEGSVAVWGAENREKTLLPNFMTQTTRGNTPIEPVAVEPDTPIAKAKADFEYITAATPPAEWEASDKLPAIIARWNIGYGHYLADSGQYEQALQVFQIAIDLAKTSDIFCDASLERSTVFSRFLKKYEAALEENQHILDEFPNAVQAESALFNSGQILLELTFKERAKERFKEYLLKYPHGKHKNNAELLLELINK